MRGWRRPEAACETAPLWRRDRAQGEPRCISTTPTGTRPLHWRQVSGFWEREHEPRFIQRNSLLRRGLITSVSVFIATGLGLAPVAAAAIFWDGTANTGFPFFTPNLSMSVGDNWTVGNVPLITDSIAFDNRSLRRTPENVISSFTTQGITFKSGALPHTITGNTIRINGIGAVTSSITNSSNSTQSLNNGLITLFG